MYSTMKNALTVNGKKIILSFYFQFSGTDRYKLFCGPMFVPALILLPYKTQEREGVDFATFMLLC